MAYIGRKLHALILACAQRNCQFLFLWRRRHLGALIKLRETRFSPGFPLSVVLRQGTQDRSHDEASHRFAYRQ